jgi:predicted dehydrogenase
MIRIAMLGCDSSHTEAYSSLFHSNDSAFFGQAKIEWLWGEDKEQALQKASACGIDNVLDSLNDERLADADMIMVCGRYGDSHFLPAKRAIELRKPTYVDKPFTNNYSEAVKLKELAVDNKVPLMSFSPLRLAKEVAEVKVEKNNLGDSYGAVVSCPANTLLIKDKRAEKIHFYGVHAADILCSVYGTGVQKLKAEKSNAGIWVSLVYSDGRHATLNLPLNVDEFYHIVIFGTKGSIVKEVDAYGDFYERTVEVLLNELSAGECRHSLEDACESIMILDAIERSLDEEREIILT